MKNESKIFHVAVYFLITRKFRYASFPSNQKSALKNRAQDAHERVRKLVAKEQRHPFGVAKCEFLLENLIRESVRNSHFVFRKY